MWGLKGSLRALFAECFPGRSLLEIAKFMAETGALVLN
jgi:hypothetical protein